MKNFPAGLAAHITQSQTTLTTLMRITRTDGVVMGFTELDQDVAFGGVTYVSGSGFQRFNIQDKQNLDTSTVQINGFMDGMVTRDDIIARKYDYAKVQIYLINWAALDGVGILFTGFFGPVILKEYGFSVDLRTLSYQTARTGGELCSPTCRVDFGSPRCGFNVNSVKQTGSVSSTDGFKTLTVSGLGNPSVANAVWDGGLLTWLTGANAGQSVEVKSVVGNSTLTLFLESFLSVNAGDTFAIIPGCNKTISACIVYSNAINFQGEPYVPGFDHLLSYPDYKAPHK